jgi:hypothetical protein
MPSHAGPNPALDSNIVFSYDTGDTSNSYRGEPTTNLLTYSTNFSAGPWYGYCGNSSNITPNTTEVVDPFGGFNATKVVRNNQTICDGSTPGWGLIYSAGGILSANNTYTTSIYARCATGTMSFRFGISDFYGSTITLTTEWQRFTLTSFYEAPAQTDRVFQFFSTDQNVTYYVCAAQTELKSHATQYAASEASQGTRSVTQGLLPLINNPTINLSSVSFDSNAQMIWDGTDDTISINSYPAIELADNVSIEYVYMRLSTDPVLDVIANKYHSTGWELFCQTGATFALAGRNGDGTYYSTSNPAYTIQNNQYYHLVAIKDGFSWRLYVNGQLYSYLTAGTIGTWSNSGILQIGGEGAGYYPNMKLPIFKIYNTALSADQVKQNYQQYKTRFNLS